VSDRPLGSDLTYMGEAPERGKSIDLWISESVKSMGLPGAQLLLADTHRRLGRFEEAQGCCHRGLSGRPTGAVRSLLEFELELIAGHDTETHFVDEVI
jgi:hypothetical protein